MTKIPVGRCATSITFDAKTNKVYVASGRVPVDTSSTVTVIDGETYATKTLTFDGGPLALAVNSRTDQIFVSDRDTGIVSIIDGATDATNWVNAGSSSPCAIAVNESTNTIYVAGHGAERERGRGIVTVIDGTTYSTTDISVFNSPIGIAINDVTNRIYVLSYSVAISVIDGLTNAELDIPTLGGGPVNNILVNKVTNKIYSVPCGNSTHTLYVLDGVSNRITVIDVAKPSCHTALDPTINKVYISGAGLDSGALSIVDGVTNAVVKVPLALGSITAVAANATSNKIYVVGLKGVAAIDGATYGVTYAMVITPTLRGLGVAIDEQHNKVYVLEGGYNGISNVIVIES
jgi:DNA-binding beta-propeller fold protein YncE